jgi:hypothetical protein
MVELLLCAYVAFPLVPNIITGGSDSTTLMVLVAVAILPLESDTVYVVV